MPRRHSILLTLLALFAGLLAFWLLAGIDAPGIPADLEREPTGGSAAGTPLLRGRQVVEQGASKEVSPHAGAGDDDSTVESMAEVTAGADPANGETERIEITGRVVDETGRPIAGISLKESWEEVDPHDEPVTELEVGSGTLGRTDAEGRFRTAIHVRVPGFVRFVIEASSAEFGGATEVWLPGRTEVEIIVRPRLVLAGVVVDERGLPIRNPRVSVVPLGGEPPFPRFEDEVLLDLDYPGTEEDMTFSLLVEGSGPYLLWCEPRDPGLAATAPQVVHAPAPNLRLVCGRGHALRGRVLNADGRYVRLHWVERDERAPTWRRVVETACHDDGRFAFERGLPARPGVLYAYSPLDGHCAFFEEVVPGTADLDVRLLEGRELRGRVLDYDPMAGAPLRLDLLWAGPTRHTEVDAAGRFRFAGVAPGPHALRWSRMGRGGLVEGAQDVDPDAGPLAIRISLPEDD